MIYAISTLYLRFLYHFYPSNFSAPKRAGGVLWRKQTPKWMAGDQELNVASDCSNWDGLPALGGEIRWDQGAQGDVLSSLVTEIQ
jgi:hypothetical protein